MRVWSCALAVLAAATLLLVACEDDSEGEATPAPTTTEAASPATATAAAAATATPPRESRELVALTHDSFDATESVIAQFEQEQNAKVTVLQGGDANQVVNRAILNAGNPEADVLFGVDNLTFQRAVQAGVFADYTSAARDVIPADILAQLGNSTAVTPIDYGFVNLNLDLAAGREPPASFEELTQPQWQGALVVEDPATSSPGLQFLASTVAHFGESGDYTWEDYWADLRANDVLITDGWTDAYYTHFSHYGGDRPLVVSYTTSPAAEVFFGELDEPPTGNVIPGTLFRQVEAAGVLAGADEPELAGAFIDFMLSEAFQAQIPETMFVYPVRPGVQTPGWWQWADVEVTPATIVATQADIDRWIERWTEIMRR